MRRLWFLSPQQKLKEATLSQFNLNCLSAQLKSMLENMPDNLRTEITGGAQRKSHLVFACNVLQQQPPVLMLW
jgi:hypothetical protein